MPRLPLAQLIEESIREEHQLHTLVELPPPPIERWVGMCACGKVWQSHWPNKIQGWHETHVKGLARP